MPNVVLAAASGGRGELPAAIRTWTVDPNGAFATPKRPTHLSRPSTLVNMVGTQHGAVPGDGFHIYGESNERYHIRGGNELLTDAIAARLPAGMIRLDSRLEAISRTPGGPVTLTIATDSVRERHVFDRVILTLPFTRLRHVDYHGAGCSSVKRQAIEQLAYGRHTKIHVPRRLRRQTQGS